MTRPKALRSRLSNVAYVWTWRWTDKLTQVANLDCGWEKNVAGALDAEHVAAVRDSTWYGLSYILNYAFNDYVSTTGRFDWFDDPQGVRTGYRGNFFSTTLGASFTPFPKDKLLHNFLLRPELRADWSANEAPFAGHCQWTAAFDIVYKF